MGIGGSIFLVAIGAILAFAVDVDLGWISLSTVGWVLMIAGIVGLIMTTIFWQSRRRTVVATPVQETRAVPVEDDRVVEEYREVRRPHRTI